MSVSTINSVSSTSTTDQSGESRVPTQTLDQNDFLKLLVVQLSQQDPMNPMKDTDFIAQMASFSALEQSKEMQADIAALRAEQQLLQANSLIGRLVDVQSADGTLVSGIVDGVQVVNGTPTLVVNGQTFTLSQVVIVAPALNSSAGTAEEGAQP
jgi:flagellar basal-body rod modification protein FlgD